MDVVLVKPHFQLIIRELCRLQEVSRQVLHRGQNPIPIEMQVLSQRQLKMDLLETKNNFTATLDRVENYSDVPRDSTLFNHRLPIEILNTL
jgi:hypothetical protein